MAKDNFILSPSKFFVTELVLYQYLKTGRLKAIDSCIVNPRLFNVINVGQSNESSIIHFSCIREEFHFHHFYTSKRWNLFITLFSLKSKPPSNPLSEAVLPLHHAGRGRDWHDVYTLRGKNQSDFIPKFVISAWFKILIALNMIYQKVLYF